MTKTLRQWPVVEPVESRRLLSLAPEGPEFRANTYTTNNQWAYAVAADADGDFVIVWQSWQDGSVYGVYAQRYDASGSPRGDEFRVNTHTLNTQDRPAVAMDADGDFVVAWTSGFQDGFSEGVYAQRYDASGAAQGPEFRVNTHTTGDQRNPAVAIDAVGNFLIAWDGTNQDGSGPGIFAQRYSASGAPQGAEVRVNTYTSASQNYPSVAMDAAGNSVVVWQSWGQDGSDEGVFARCYDAAGKPRGGEFRVNMYTARAQDHPSVAMDADGDFVVAWQSLMQNSVWFAIYARRYDADAVPQGAEFRVDNPPSGIGLFPSVAMDGDGRFVVGWQGDDGSASGVFARQYSRDGTLVQSFRANTYTLNQQRDARVALDASGDLVIAWMSEGQDGSGYGAYAQRYEPVPAVVASSFHFRNDPHRLTIRFDEDVADSIGTDDLTVQNLTTAQTVPSSDFSLVYNSSTRSATFTYTGSLGGQPGVMSDGNYRATLRAAGVHTPNGNTLPADHVFEFTFLMGDANNDGRVNLQDFNILAANFGQSPRDFSQGDFNYDGTVNLQDFNILAGRFGAALAPSTSIFDTSPAGARARTDVIDDLEEMHASVDT